MDTDLNVGRFDNLDWQAYSGAEKFADETDPFIFYGRLSSGKDVVVIADATGCQVSYTTVAGDEIVFFWEEKYLPAQAKIAAERMAELLNGCRHPRAVLTQMRFREITMRPLR